MQAQKATYGVELQRSSVLDVGGTQSYGVKTEKGAATAASAPKKRQNGVQLAVQILQKEGLRGLYRGFGASIATFVPSSAIWYPAQLSSNSHIILTSDASMTQRGPSM